MLGSSLGCIGCNQLLQLNGTTFNQLYNDGTKYESLSQMEADIRNLELRFEKVGFTYRFIYHKQVQNDIADVIDIKEAACTAIPATIPKPVLNNLASRQNGTVTLRYYLIYEQVHE